MITSWEAAKMSEEHDRFSMKPYDATKYLRQMKYLPDVSPLIAILWVFLMLYFYASSSGYYGYVCPPEGKYSHPEPSRDVLPNIFLTYQGNMYLDGSKIEPIDIPRVIADMKCNDKKVLFTADAYSSWGKIVDVLISLKKSKIQVVGLITDKYFSVLDYSQQQQVYREKGLKIPESAK